MATQNSLTADQLRQLERQLNQGAVPFSPPTVPSDNGLLRQPPNIPNTAPTASQAQRLIEDLNKRTAPTPTTAPTPSTPIPPINTPPSASLGQRVNTALTSPISFPAADKVNNVLNKAGNAAAVASVALSVGGSLANAVRNPNANALAQSAVTTAAGALLLAPNPYAKAAGLALSVLGSPIVNLVFPSKENVAPSRSALPFSGGQNDTLYRLYISYTVIATGARVPSFPFNSIQGGIRGAESFTNINESSGIIVYGKDGQVSFSANSSFYRDFTLDRVERVDGLPDPDKINYVPLVINDGRSTAPPFDFDPSAIGDALKKLEDLKNSVNGLSDDNVEILNQLRNLANPSTSNPLQSAPVAPNSAPLPSIAPPDSKAPKKDDDKESLADKLKKLAPNSTPSAASAPLAKAGSSNLVDQVNQIKKANEEHALKDTKNTTQNQQDRFRDPKDCQFSCENLAKCFTDLKVQIFDGCNPENGTAKTKEITIQVLPKDKAKTEASFKELLDIRSRECSLNDRVLSVPEYWQVRVGQKPQAAIVYREFKDGKFTNSCWTLHIPHYTGNKNSKPNLSQYSKGESSAIYVCKDNSQLQVYASTEAEAKRLINQLEKYIDPKFRGDIVKYGTRKGIKKTTVRPVRLDYYSTGQLSLSPDWSIAL
ncbi:hypothetical protein PseudUWO311_00605 [Pseudanabaena sp. UWO311]|uniref:hypothetical protein n=1 Tax=Pseudanabaena sp. UWO311 TaxID=2487337 RepID=UPI0011592B31|nr:hypothetical protein [Pseudanabaena sp. UWO311]TYQ29431.1 hypothetical protein PseudUWO311_00605 [Pseudanabaena sp. UWO311]